MAFFSYTLLFILFGFNSLAQLPAFPGAEGFGKYAMGGRGGEVYHVMNLMDAGPGSLRYALENRKRNSHDEIIPRTVVFRVAGTIHLLKEIVIADPFLTIAGQTAPGGGICIIANHSFCAPAITIRSNDIIIRYLKMRYGPAKKVFLKKHEYCEDCAGCDKSENISIRGKSAYNIVIDHCSLSWSADNNASVWSDPFNITFQYCIFSEGLLNSSHSHPNHSKGLLVGGGTDKLTVYRNLFAHNSDRNPWVKANDEDFNTSVFQVVNNVNYNWGYRAFDNGTDYSEHWAPKPGHTKVNIIGNYFKPGPSTEKTNLEIQAGGINVKLYVNDNIGPFRSADSLNQWNNVGLKYADLDMQANSGTHAPPEKFQAEKPFDTPELPIIFATDAYNLVLEQAGAIKPMRDEVDLRVTEEVRSGSGKIPDYPVYENLPALAKGEPYPDHDQDGMDDHWEKEYGLNSNDPNDRNLDPDKDGYTNLEEFLNESDPTLISTIL